MLKTILPEQVLGEKRPGKKIGISGDTMPTKELEKFFEKCDYLVFDSTFLDETKEKAEDTCHSTAKQAATLGKNAKVKNLILTHFSARYKDETRHLEEAKQIPYTSNPRLQDGIKKFEELEETNTLQERVEFYLFLKNEVNNYKKFSKRK